MPVKDREGRTWLQAQESADRHGVRVETLYEWTRRTVKGSVKVRSWKLDGRLWVCDDDVADAERKQQDRAG